MTKDYKNVPRTSARKGTGRRPASKKGTASSKKRSAKTTPGWLWMLGGLAIGLGVAALIYFVGDEDETLQTATRAAKEVLKPATSDTTSAQDTPAEKEERFDFYTLLPELEVIIPESEIKEGQARIQERDDVAYMIQVGSFRNYGDADSLKAQLALLGIEADIEPVSSKGEQWLRVRVGPFTSKRELNRIRNRLHSNNINTMLVQIKQ